MMPRPAETNVPPGSTKPFMIGGHPDASRFMVGGQFIPKYNPVNSAVDWDALVPLPSVAEGALLPEHKLELFETPYFTRWPRMREPPGLSLEDPTTDEWWRQDALPGLRLEDLPFAAEGFRHCVMKIALCLGGFPSK